LAQRGWVKMGLMGSLGVALRGRKKTAGASNSRKGRGWGKRTKKEGWYGTVRFANKQNQDSFV